jgi:hypothetical protein
MIWLSIRDLVGTFDFSLDFFFGHLFHLLFGGFNLFHVELIVFAGLFAKEIENSKGLFLGKSFPLNQAEQGLEALCSVDFTAVVLVNLGECIFERWLLTRFIRADGRRKREHPLAVRCAFLIHLLPFLNSFVSNESLIEVNRFGVACFVKTGVTGHEFTEPFCSFLIKLSPFNSAGESFCAFLSINIAALVLVKLGEYFLWFQVIFILGFRPTLRNG